MSAFAIAIGGAAESRSLLSDGTPAERGPQGIAQTQLNSDPMTPRSRNVELGVPLEDEGRAMRDYASLRSCGPAFGGRYYPSRKGYFLRFFFGLSGCVVSRVTMYVLRLTLPGSALASLASSAWSGPSLTVVLSSPPMRRIYTDTISTPNVKLSDRGVKVVSLTYI